MPIKVHLSKILGEKKLKVSNLVRMTGISRRGLDKIYHEETGGIDFEVLEKLCEALDVPVGELLEHIPKNDDTY